MVSHELIRRDDISMMREILEDNDFAVIDKDDYSEILKRAAVCEKITGKKRSYTALVKEIERLK